MHLPPRHFVFSRLKRAVPRVGSRHCFVIGPANVPNESEEAREVASEGCESVSQSNTLGPGGLFNRGVATKWRGDISIKNLTPRRLSHKMCLHGKHENVSSRRTHPPIFGTYCDGRTPTLNFVSYHSVKLGLPGG